MNGSEQVLWSMDVECFGHGPRSGVTESHGRATFIFLKFYTLISRMTEVVSTPINNE